MRMGPIKRLAGGNQLEDALALYVADEQQRRKRTRVCGKATKKKAYREGQ